ncbi:serpin family protein [Mycoplasmatota bacterium zrk1]
MKKIFTIIAIMTLSVILVACDKDANQVDEELKTPLNGGVENPLVTVGNSEFAFDIFKELNKEDYDENIFISPFSISSALAMTLNGADGETKAEMEEALRLNGMSIEDINNGFAYLNNMLTNYDEYVEVNIANSLWLNDQYELNEPFRYDIKSNYNGDSSKLDFNGSKSVDIVNDWVSNKTNELIDEIILKLDFQDILVLINTIYFNGSWSSQFNPKLTEIEDFYALDGSTTEVDMMKRTENGMSYFENEEMTAVKLPYGVGRYSMYVILPNDGEDINSFITNMDRSKWDECRNGFSNYKVTLELPKFKMEYGIKELSGVLENLGMEKAFYEEDAEFPNMIEGMDGGLFISRVNHKAVVEVMEVGTEAAAATAVVVEVECAPPQYEEREFITNRPFMFVIGDREGNILFIGKKIS